MGRKVGGGRLKPLTPDQKLQQKRKRQRRKTNTGEQPVSQKEQPAPIKLADPEPIKLNVAPTTPISLEAFYQCPLYPRGGCESFEKIDPNAPLAEQLVNKGLNNLCYHWWTNNCSIGAIDKPSKSVA